jgi:GMP synthase-like glutamine amidotransferase
MKPALIVTHLADRHSGLVGEAFAHSGYPVIEHNLIDDAPLPSVDELSAVVSLGGRESATDLGRHPFLAQEVALLRAALQRGVPILGLCLGAQLLAVAAGGMVSTMDSLCLGWPELARLPAAPRDPVFAELASGLSVLKWHEDRIDAPPGATLLASSPPGTALFRVGPVAWGSQMHLEVTPSMLLDGWLTEADGIAEIEAAGRPIADFRSECRVRLPAQMAAARRVLMRFVHLAARSGAGLHRAGAD